MKYCGLAKIERGVIVWAWWEQANYKTDVFGEKTFEEYCKKYEGTHYTYVEVDDDEL